MKLSITNLAVMICFVVVITAICVTPHPETTPLTASILARITAAQARIAGMQAENQFREGLK